jgi:hypothetical protein
MQRLKFAAVDAAMAAGCGAAAAIRSLMKIDAPRAASSRIAGFRL